MTAKAFSAVLATAVLLASGHALAQATTLETDIGEVLVGEGEMTLYTFRNDEAGVSNCYDDCAVNWPPFLAEEGATAEEPYSLVERTDGTLQWAYNGMPLYYWIQDAEPGDTTGDGVGDNWDVARPE